MTMRCKFCGSELTNSESFCSFCGTKIEQTEHVETEMPKYICSNCKKEYNAGTKFCSECGGKVEEVKPAAPVVFACTGCGKEYPAGTKFCSECGGKVTKGGTDTASEPCTECETSHETEINTGKSSVDPEQTTDQNAAIVQECKEILKSFHNNKEIFVTGFSQKLNIAMESYGTGLVRSEKDIIVHIDSTVFGGAKEGFIITPYGAAFKRLFQSPQKVFFDQSVKLEIKGKDNEEVDLWEIWLNENVFGCFVKDNSIALNTPFGEAVVEVLQRLIDRSKNTPSA